jgi:Subtilase family
MKIHGNRFAESSARRWCLALVVCAGAAIPATSMGDIVLTTPTPGVLDLRTGQVQTRDRVNLMGGNGAFAAETFYLLQLDGPLTGERQASLEAAGVKLGQYIPHFAYVVKLEKSSPAALRQLGFVTWVGTADASWKIDPQLGAKPITDPVRLADRAAGKSWVSVVLHENAGAIDAVEAIRAAGGVVTNIETPSQDTYIDAVIPTASALKIAETSEILFIEESVEIVKRNDSNRWIAQSNVSAQTPVWNRGIQGQGQMGGLIDDPVHESHCMFDDSVAVGPTHRKIVAMRLGTSAGSHGTHTAGTFAGDNTPRDAYTTHDGLAFRAKLSCTNLGGISSSNLETNLNAAYNDGARVHSNSWGDDGTVSYTSHCRQIDNHSYLKEDSLVLFAVTNQSALKTPENAKNCVGVGASQDANSQGNHCSGGVGTTNDGRRKPEAYLPGCNTISASVSTCGTTGSTGTSMACPAVSGAALLVRQYYTDGFYPTGAAVPANSMLPSSALVKATLLNSCVDMTGISGYPSNLEGWGRVLLDNALHFTGDLNKLLAYDVRNVNGFTTGQSTNYPFNVTTAGAPLKISLVWTEPPAAVNANPAYINDLNLTVTDPSGNVYRGNVFTSGQSSTGGVADIRNNVEMVLRSSPTVGAWTVTVSAQTVNAAAKQGYALVITGDVGTCSAPSISGQPGNQTVNVYSPASFIVTAAGTGLSYQWKKDGSNIGGATSSTFSIPNATLSDEGVYSVQITGTCGNVTSANATLDVICKADFDNSGFVDSDDFDAFVLAFEAGDISADIDGTGFTDTDDYDAFVDLFEAGC